MQSRFQNNCSPAHPNKEGLDHAIGFFNFWLPSIRINGCLNYLHNIITKIQLQESHKILHQQDYLLYSYIIQLTFKASHELPGE